MKSAVKKIKHTFEYCAILILLLPLRILPVKLSVAIGGICGGLLWKFGVRRVVSRFNISLCFPEYDNKKIDDILEESYKNFCRSMVEFALLPKMRNNISRLATFPKSDELMKMAETGEGSIFVSGHFGSWELMGAAVAGLGIPVDFLVGEQSNPAVDSFINRIRAKMGVGIIHMGVAARGVIQSVRNGRTVAMLSDQDAGRSAVIVDFFGHKVSTPQGVAAFALKLKCPIVLAATYREGNSIRHRIETEIIRPDYSSLPPEKADAIRVITQEYTNHLEQAIRRAPQMYFWPHRRFKHSVEYPK
ncbi:MAG TPA: hypothetical protein ENN07_05080 [candidate division Zixibacteria bacterium]|nr:hypothetical protein [candidate division Zixibacteria bacterium]